MNSTLGSVVPLAMFCLSVCLVQYSNSVRRATSVPATTQRSLGPLAVLSPARIKARVILGMKPLSCSQGPSLQLLCMACLTTFEYMGDISKIESSLGFFSLQTHASAELTVQIFWNSRDTLSICPLFHPITKSSPSRPVYIRCFEDSEAEAEGRSLCWPGVWCAGQGLTPSRGKFFHCTLPCRHMCSKQALVCTASCSVLSISKTARTVTTNFRFWSTIRNPSGAYLIWGVSLETMKSPSGGFSALGGEWAPPSEAQNLR